MTPFDVRLWRVLSIRLASVVCPVLPLDLTSVPRCRFRPWLRQGGAHEHDRGWHAELGSGRDAGDVLPSLEKRRTGLNRRGQGAGVLISGYIGLYVLLVGWLFGADGAVTVRNEGRDPSWFCLRRIRGGMGSVGRPVSRVSLFCFCERILRTRAF